MDKFSCRYAHATVTGESHLVRNEECQDASKIHYLSNDIVIGVLADGAGSAKFGGLGAKKICEIAIDIIRTNEMLLEQLEAKDDSSQIFEYLKKIFDDTMNELKDFAYEQGYEIRDLASTLVAFVASPYSLASLEVGDSLLIFKSSEEDINRLVSTPTKGEYVNETIFVTHNPSDEQVKCNVKFFSTEAPLQFVCAISDGVETVSIDRLTYEPSSSFFDPVHNACLKAANNDELTEYIEQLLSMKELSKRSNDDKTMLLVNFLVNEEMIMI